jgi:hypothetical protein
VLMAIWIETVSEDASSDKGMRQQTWNPHSL